MGGKYVRRRITGKKRKELYFPQLIEDVRGQEWKWKRMANEKLYPTRHAKKTQFALAK